MKAPDKIYVLLNEHTGFLSHTFTNVPCGYESSQDIEYIRKDAMLEWAKEKAEDYKGTANIRRSFEMMIRKIESL